jgi:hypothetical protein
MTTLGGFAMLVCVFIMPPIIFINRSEIDGIKLWLIAPPVIALSYYIGWVIGVAAFECGFNSELDFHATIATQGIVSAPIVTLLIFISKRKRRREAEAKHRKIQHAIEKIKDHGGVHGPKGPYVHHTPWNVGTEPRTPRETKGPRSQGPYGAPMP